jgi:hypothetical protein
VKRFAVGVLFVCALACAGTPVVLTQADMDVVFQASDLVATHGQVFTIDPAKETWTFERSLVSRLFRLGL